jgi:hypothetical protein
LPRNETNYKFNIQARTLTSIIKESNIINIDLISIDVEGYEINVLEGIDLNQINVNYILIETNQKTLIEKYLEKYNFQLIAILSHHDYLFKNRVENSYI